MCDFAEHQLQCQRCGYALLSDGDGWFCPECGAWFGNLVDIDWKLTKKPAGDEDGHRSPAV